MDNEVLKSIALILCPLLVGLLTWFIRNLVVKTTAQVEQLDRSVLIMGKDIEVLSANLKNVAHVGAEWALMKQDVGQVILEIKNLKSALEDVVILKRDHKTMWKRIDELRDDVRSNGKGSDQ